MAASTIYLGGGPTLPISQRILQFPLTRILLALVFFMVPFLLIQGASTHFFDEKLFTRMGQLLGAVVGCLSYAFYVIRIEKRAVTELSLHGAWQEYGLGFLAGGLMMCISVAAIAALGGLRILSTNPDAVIILPLLMHITVGIIEEMLLRGILFRVVQESLGSWIALAASGLVFGALHLVNDNITALAIANLVGAGVFLGSAYLLTGRLWLAAGLHAAWNFVQEGIFSVAVSGHEVKAGLMLTERSGPDWLTGGAFGIEGSAIDLVVVVLTSIVMVALAQRRGRIVPPFWKRKFMMHGPQAVWST